MVSLYDLLGFKKGLATPRLVSFRELIQKLPTSIHALFLWDFPPPPHPPGIKRSLGDMWCGFPNGVAILREPVRLSPFRSPKESHRAVRNNTDPVLRATLNAASTPSSPPRREGRIMAEFPSSRYGHYLLPKPDRVRELRLYHEN